MDTFTCDVIEAEPEAAATEMFEVIRKAAMSRIIYEVLDVGTGIANADRPVYRLGVHIPGFPSGHRAAQSQAAPTA